MPASRLPAVIAIAALIVATATGCSTTSSLLPSLSLPPTADQVVQQLATRVPSAKLGITYTAENDPNHLLGRPNGYASKVSFTDSRVDQKLLEGQRPDAIDAGGSVEVYPNADGAARRAKYIQDLQRAAPILGTEYAYLDGPVLVRCWCGCPGSSPPHRPTSTRPLSTPLRACPESSQVGSGVSGVGRSV